MNDVFRRIVELSSRQRAPRPVRPRLRFLYCNAEELFDRCRIADLRWQTDEAAGDLRIEHGCDPVAAHRVEDLQVLTGRMHDLGCRARLEMRPEVIEPDIGHGVDHESRAARRYLQQAKLCPVRSRAHELGVDPQQRSIAERRYRIVERPGGHYGVMLREPGWHKRTV